MHPFWQSCVTDFQQELSPHQYNTWIKPLRFEQEGDSFTLIAPNRHVLQWAKERVLNRVEQSGEKFFARPIYLELALEEAEIEAVPPLDNGDSPDEQPLGARQAAYQNGTSFHAMNGGTNNGSGKIIPHRINPAFTFASFVGGKANQLARAAALQVGQNPGQAYNPLFIYGTTGLGKTHLVQAIGNQLLEQNPNANIRYIHAEQFVTDVVKAYQHKAFDSFKRSYHTLDLLLIDENNERYSISTIIGCLEPNQATW